MVQTLEMLFELAKGVLNDNVDCVVCTWQGPQDMGSADKATGSSHNHLGWGDGSIMPNHMGPFIKTPPLIVHLVATCGCLSML